MAGSNQPATDQMHFPLVSVSLGSGHQLKCHVSVSGRSIIPETSLDESSRIRLVDIAHMARPHHFDTHCSTRCLRPKVCQTEGYGLKRPHAHLVVLLQGGN